MQSNACRSLQEYLNKLSRELYTINVMRMRAFPVKGSMKFFTSERVSQFPVETHNPIRTTRAKL